MKLNGRVINPGEMQTSITLLSRDVIVEAGGFQVPDFDEIATVWSRWTNVHGSEAWVAGSIQAENPATVLIRYRDDVDATCLVQKGENLYEIVSIDNVQERNEFIELKVKRWIPG